MLFPIEHAGAEAHPLWVADEPAKVLTFQQSLGLPFHYLIIGTVFRQVCVLLVALLPVFDVLI
jgi:hypothetical protein